MASNENRDDHDSGRSPHEHQDINGSSFDAGVSGNNENYNNGQQGGVHQRGSGGRGSGNRGNNHRGSGRRGRCNRGNNHRGRGFNYRGGGRGIYQRFRGTNQRGRGNRNNFHHQPWVFSQYDQRSFPPQGRCSHEMPNVPRPQSTKGETNNGISQDQVMDLITQAFENFRIQDNGNHNGNENNDYRGQNNQYQSDHHQSNGNHDRSGHEGQKKIIRDHQDLGTIMGMETMITEDKIININVIIINQMRTMIDQVMKDKTEIIRDHQDLGTKMGMETMITKDRIINIQVIIINQMGIMIDKVMKDKTEIIRNNKISKF